MDRLEVVDISTLPRGKPLETPLCKKRIRAWTPKVQSVAKSPKTLNTPADDDVAPDTDSHVPPVARAPRQNTPQTIAPSFSQLEIVDISTLPRGKPLETPLCKKRIRAWTPKMQNVAGSPKTLDTTADDAPNIVSHVPPVEGAPRQNTTDFWEKVKNFGRSPAPSTRVPLKNTSLFPVHCSQFTAPSFSQLEIVDISTLLGDKPIQISKNRKRARNPKGQSVARSPKTLDSQSVDDVAAPDTDSSLPPKASSSRNKNTPPSIARNTCQKVKSVGRPTKTIPSVVGDTTSLKKSCLPRAAGFPRIRQNRPIPKLEIVHISTLLRDKPIKMSENRKRAWNPKVKSVRRSTKKMVTSVVGDATPLTNERLPPALTMPKPNDKAKVKAKKIYQHVNNYTAEIPIQPEEAQHSNNQDMCESDPSKHVKTPKRVECQVCDKKFKYQCKLKNHMRTHTGEKPFKCNKCKHAFKQKYLLNKHIVTSHETDGLEKSKMSCAVCNETFLQREELLKHLEKHVTLDDDNKFSCCVCGNKFQGKNYLIFHLERHSDKKHTCKICKRKFKYKEDYKTHMDFHDMQKKQPAFYCSICTAVFTHKNIFESHMRLHTGEKPFSCDTCEQKFAFKVALVKHVCIDGERPYMRRLEPNICNKCHTQLPNQIKIPAGEKPLCETCKTKYAFEDPLATHSINEDTAVTEQNIGGKEINKIQTVKVERNEIWIEVSGRMESETEIKRELERDEDIEIGEINIEIQPIKREVNGEF